LLRAAHLGSGGAFRGLNQCRRVRALFDPDRGCAKRLASALRHKLETFARSYPCRLRPTERDGHAPVLTHRLAPLLSLDRSVLNG
jgi:hypothetical protein